MPMKKILIILLSGLFLPIKAQSTYTYTLPYHNTEVKVELHKKKDGKIQRFCGLYRYGKEILPVRYEYEYNEMLKLFIFHNGKEAIIISALTGNAVKYYTAPKRSVIHEASFRPITSFTFEAVVKTSKETTLATYTVIRGKVHKIPPGNRYVVH